MIKFHIEHLISNALEKLQQKDALSQFELPAIQIDATKDKQHGDFASNIALILAKTAKKPPRELAELIVQTLMPSPNISKVEVAGPGFLNFYVTAQALQSIITTIIHAGASFGHTNIGMGKKILLEFVSSNPTGPLHVGHGRHAAYGMVVADLLTTVGYEVFREYYVNDAGRQMDILAVSVFIRYLESFGNTLLFPASGYKGEYVNKIAEELKKQKHKEFYLSALDIFNDLPLDEKEGGDKEIYIDALIVKIKKLLGDARYNDLLKVSLDSILADIDEDLAEFGVHFDNWFSERNLTQSDVVDRMIATLQKNGKVYEKEGALWFRSTDYGDEKDRVLQRSNGQRTYFANDLAYHIGKFERQFDVAIDIFGSDHHGYVPRMKAGLEAFGIAPEKLTYLLVQFVDLYRGSEKLPMSTRSGSFVTLRTLRDEVGNDAARFFYVMRRCEQPVDFDLELAKSQTNENPVFYVQYAHARICSVFRQLLEKDKSFDQADGLNNLGLLNNSHELDLLNTLSRYCEIIVNAAKQYEPHILTNYLRELANDFHGYYNAHQFIVEDSALRNARLSLIVAVRQVIANGLKILGVSQPQSM